MTYSAAAPTLLPEKYTDPEIDGREGRHRMHQRPAPPVCLSVAGLDPSGGAGLLADVLTIRACGGQPAAVATALTVQDSRGAHRFEPAPVTLLRDQLTVLLADLPVAVVKTGMLGQVATVEMLAEVLTTAPDLPLVVDPVLGASAGVSLAQPGLASAIREVLLPRATVVTPNLAEAAALTGGPPITEPAGMRAAAQALTEHGCTALITGGHLEGVATDLLRLAGGQELWFPRGRVPGPDPRGTGCRHSAALATALARGCDLARAAGEAQEYLARLLARPRLTPGRGAPHLDDLTS